MHTLRTLMSALALAATVTAAAQAQPTYTLTDVGTPAGCDRAYARSLNAGGDVVASCYNGARGLPKAFAWRNGTIVSLGMLARGTYAEPTAINDLGVVAGYGDNDRAAMLGWVTTSAGLAEFFSNNGGFTRPMFMANSGFIGGRYTTSKGGWVASIRGAIWTPDPKDPRKYRKTDLPILPGGIDPKQSYSHPNGFNHLGQAVGFGTTDQIAPTPVLWQNDAAHTMVTLPVLTPGAWGEAVAINAVGQIAGFDNVGLTLPVFWQNDAAHTVSALPLLAGHSYGTVIGMNDGGSVIGLSGYRLTPTDAADDHAVVWLNGQAFELQTLLDPLTAQGYIVTEVAAINNAGQIAATATLNGVPRAVLLTPVAAQ